MPLGLVKLIFAWPIILKPAEFLAVEDTQVTNVNGNSSYLRVMNLICLNFSSKTDVCQML